MRPSVVAIVPAAGQGKRLGLKVKKPFVRLKGKPLASYALETLDGCKAVDAILIAAERPCVKPFKKLVNKLKLKKVIDVIVGGRTRFESVKNCLRFIGPFFDIVLVHDAARPCVGIDVIEESVKAAHKFGACIAAVPESDTIKLADSALFIKKTIDRNKVFRAQTPQAFRYELIKKAYAVKRSAVTDDASLIEKLGGRVKIVKGSYGNIKVTTKEDLKLAEVLL